MHVQLRIIYRFQTHWEGGYTKEQFQRTIQPLIDKFPNQILERVKFSNASGYVILLQIQKEEAIQLRKDLDYGLRILHHKAPRPIFTVLVES